MSGEAQGRWRKQSTPEPAGLPHAQVVQGHFQGQQDCGAMKGEGGGALGMDTQTLWLNENMFHERESLADTGCLWWKFTGFLSVGHVYARLAWSQNGRKPSKILMRREAYSVVTLLPQALQGVWRLEAQVLICDHPGLTKTCPMERHSIVSQYII